MTPSPRFTRYVAVACFASFPALYQPAITHAQISDGVDAAPQVDEGLLRDVRNFWHYGKIARYDLAVLEGQKVLQRADQPVDVLEAFEQVAGERPDLRADVLDEWLLRWQGVEEMNEVSTGIIRVLSAGYLERSGDPAFIEANIQRLSRGRRAYVQAMARLRESGELAVPLMVDYLRDSTKREYHTATRTALRDLGRVALNPLLASLDMKEEEPLIQIIHILGDIGYDASVPYLVHLSRSGPTRAVQTAAVNALERLGAGNPAGLDAARLFHELSERFYYENAAVASDAVNNTSNVWRWEDGKGLLRDLVPAAVFNELMSMKTAEQSLRLDPNRDDTISLWLAANYKREAELVADAAAGVPDTDVPAHFYGVSAGARYLNPALTRALNDRNSAVALKVVKSLQEISGQSNLFSGQEGQPLIDALRYADRLVRFEAAFALAAALPQQSFQGQEFVVPLLTEAISQTGTPNVLVAAPAASLNGLVEGLREQGYGAVGASTAEAAINQAMALPAVDVIVISDDLDGREIDRLFQLSGQTPRLARTSKVVLNKIDALKLAGQAASDPLLNITTETDPAALKPVIEQARERSGSVPLDAQVATQYALRAAELLARVAISRGQVYDLTVAEQPLLHAVANDSRNDVVQAVGRVLGLIESKNAQLALLAEAADAQTADEVKISLYNSLATNARFFGNQLTSEETRPLQDEVKNSRNQLVRNAAAEAHGALNLPADQAKELILAQPK